MGKLMGALLLAGGGLALGMGWAQGLRQRAGALAGWLAALELLEGELSLTVPSTPDLLKGLSSAPAPAGEVFAAALRGMDRLGEQSFAQIWTAALAESPGALAGEDRKTLELLGRVLGRCGREDQRRAVRRTWEELDGRLKTVREELARKGRAYGTVGLAGGLFLVLLLW